MFDTSPTEVTVGSATPELSIEATGLDAFNESGIITGAKMHNMDERIKATGGVGTVDIECKDLEGHVVNADTKLIIGTPVTLNCTATDSVSREVKQIYKVKPSKSARARVP